MPTYAFACTECGNRFEKQMSSRENRAEITCPQGHRAVRRVYTAPQVVFKGSGWYKTDQRGKNPVGASTSE
jgi:putative FmdB family regulatory protein